MNKTISYNVLEEVKSAEGNNISLCALLSNKDLNKNKTLIIGVVHGDEPQGELLINKYMEEHENKNLLFIPCLNPDGRNKGTRTNSNNVDINRNFPTNNWERTEYGNYYGGAQPTSEIETKFLVNIIEKYKPLAIITLHTPYKIVNYDGPAQELAGMISDIIGYPVEPSIGYPTPGSFGTYAGVERSIPTITLELDEYASIESLYEPIEEIFDNL